MTTDHLISVVVPVYNEAANIAACLVRIASALGDHPHEVVVVYDFDEDSTLPAIEAMGDKKPASVRLVRNDLGRGVAYALKAGFAAALGDVVVTTMADLSDPPEVIPPMSEKIRAGAAVVSGSRYMKGGSQTGGPRLKRFLSRMAGLTLHWFAGVRTHDATNNFRAYSRDFLATTPLDSTRGFEVGLELTVKAHINGYVVDEVPSSWVDRSAGESRFQLFKWLPAYLRWYGLAFAAPLIRSSASAGRWLFTPSGLMWVVVWALLALSLLSLPHYVAGDDLDPSWQQGLGHALKRGWIAGEDFVFTYGPLGALHSDAYEEATFAICVWWATTFAAFASLVLCLAAARLPGPRRRFAFLLLVWAVPAGKEARVLLVIATTAILILQPEPKQRTGWLAWFAAAFLAVGAQIKFTYFVVGSFAGAAIVFQRWRTSGWRAAIALAVFAVVVFVVAGLSAGQRIDSLVSYVIASAEVAKGYTAAMSIYGRFAEVVLAIAILGLSTATLLLSARRPDMAVWLSSVALILALLFIAWKYGFVRHDGHALTFFAFAVAMPFLLWPWVISEIRWKAVVQHLSLWAVVGIAISGANHVMNAKPYLRPWTTWVADANHATVAKAERLFHLGSLEQQMKRQRSEKARQFALPKIAKAAGKGGVDLIGHSQGVLLLNDLNWAPRPVFQSYSAYTEALARRNRDYFAGSNAPPFVMLDGRAIDGRLPTMNDGPALLEVLRCYEPLVFERGYALLHRRVQPLDVGDATLFEASVGLGEWIDIQGLGNGSKQLSLEFDSGLATFIRSLLFKPPIIHLEVDFAGGTTATFRIVPAMMTDGVLIDPLPRNAEQWWHIFHGYHGPAVKRVRVIRDPDVVDWIGGPIRVRIKEAAQPPPAAGAVGGQRPPFSPAPDFADTANPSSVREMQVDGRAALFVHAPGQVAWRIKPGKYRLAGSFCIVPGAYTGDGATNGVGFRVQLEGDGNDRSLFKRDLRPLTKETDRGFHSFSVTFKLDTDGVLTLRTVPLGDSRWDWSCWSGVTLQPRDRSD